MKNIKEYINESLFDSEDDLLDKNPTDAIIEWFDENVKFIKRLYYYPIPTKEVLSIDDKGIISFQISHGCDHIEYYKQPPSFIKFDEKSCMNTLTASGTMTCIYYDVISQKDIKNIPLDKFNRIAEFQNNKTQNLILNNWTNINSENIKNITYNVNTEVLIGVKDIDQLTEIKFSKYSDQNRIILYYNDLGQKLSKEHGKLRTKKFVNKYRDVLTKMRNNNVYALQLNEKKVLVLDNIL